MDKMENLHGTESQGLNETVYPQHVNETKSIVNPQFLLWALIAVVLYVIYRQQPDKDSMMGSVQLAIIAVCALMAIVKLFVGDRKLIYAPTGSLIEREVRHYNVAFESDIRLCLREGNVSRLNALKTDDAGGIMVEVLVSKDKSFTAMRMQKYSLEGYHPVTQWVVIC